MVGIAKGHLHIAVNPVKSTGEGNGEHRLRTSGQRKAEIVGFHAEIYDSTAFERDFGKSPFVNAPNFGIQQSRTKPLGEEEESENRNNSNDRVKNSSHAQDFVYAIWQ